MTTDEFRELALSFPEAVEAPHFDRIAFKVAGKKIFATLHTTDHSANLKLSEVDQPAFCSYNEEIVYPVPNKWGLQGWTTFELKNAPHELMLEALETAYKETFNIKPRKRK